MIPPKSLAAQIDQAIEVDIDVWVEQKTCNNELEQLTFIDDE